MKKLYLIPFLVLSILMNSRTPVSAACFPAYFASTTPAAGGFLYDKKISFTFIDTGGDMSVVGGYIRIYKKSTNVVVDSIKITDYYQAGWGAPEGVFVFPITSMLECNTEFYIHIDYHAFTCINQMWFDSIRDSHGNIFEWNFTTAPTPITFTKGSPAYFCGGGTTTLTANEAHSYLWSTGDTSRTITVRSTNYYSVTSTYINGCSVTDSSSISSLPPGDVPICMVTVDSLSQFNQVIWTKPYQPSIDSFVVYREITTDTYKRLGAVPYRGALSIFVDTVRTKYFPNTGDPNAGTYRYKLQILDTCGSYSDLSPFHNTIFISNNNGTFTWPRLYTIENGNNPVNSYVLMRDDSSSGHWHAINSVSGTQYTVTDPAYKFYNNIAKWRVETLWNIICIPTNDKTTSTYSTSMSNKASKETTGLADLQFYDLFSLYPNPSTGIITLKVKRQDNPEYKVKIFNCTGELMLEKQTTSSISTFDLSDKAEGIYYLQAEIGGNSYSTKVVLNKK
jgi:hypothetical protein